MTKYDRDYCKPDENMKPLYCPLPLAVVIHHHDEWDEPVIDPETGEPTGETEHKTADWDEKRTEVFPSVEDKAAMGYLPLIDERPVDPPEGKHYERTGKIEPGGDGYRWVYVLVDNPTPAPRRWTRLSIKNALADARLLPAAKQFLAEFEMKPDYSALESFGDCNYIEENYGGAEKWSALLDGAANALGKTREEIDAFLDTIPTEGGV